MFNNLINYLNFLYNYLIIFYYQYLFIQSILFKYYQY